MDELLNEKNKKYANSLHPGQNIKSANLYTNTIDIFKSFEEAASKITPIWDNRDYVAVNPFFGFRKKNIIKVFKYIQTISGKSLFPKKDYFLQKFNKGELLKADIKKTINQLKENKTFANYLENYSVNDVVNYLHSNNNDHTNLNIKSLSDLYDFKYRAHTSENINNDISIWLSAFYDEGQAFWSAKPESEKTNLYIWWKNLVKYEKLKGKHGEQFHGILNDLPDSKNEALFFLSNKLITKYHLKEDELSDYFYRLLFSNLGWASFIQHFYFESTRNKSLVKNHSSGLLDLLIIRLVYDLSFIDFIDIDDIHLLVNIDEEKHNEETIFNYILLNSTEHSYAKKIINQISKNLLKKYNKTKPDVQMVFCIDVRSEVIRRNIEILTKKIETIGFAGFFGMEVNFLGLGHANPDQNCPILLEPKVLAKELSECNEKNIVKKKRKYADFIQLNSIIKNSGISSFSFVETFGFKYIVDILKASLNYKNVNIDSNNLGLTKKEISKIKLDVKHISFEDKLKMTLNTLSGLGLKNKFSKYIFIIGHGSQTTNNPYSSALDCGACGGHHGTSNARMLVHLLNDPEIRKGLSRHNIHIPPETQFISGWHNTTTEDIHVDKEGLDSEELQEYLNIFKKASHYTRIERSKFLPWAKDLDANKLKKEFQIKASDWSEIRPEWGLARNASFIIGKRELTRTVNFEGRSFLHDYDYKADHDHSLLEAIMTAPMIVTNWINMQYYASTIDPVIYGSGNKTMNNVTGLISCIQGNQSDLLTGLSEQSVWYQGRYFHEPLRLQVFIQAKDKIIEQIISTHNLLKELVNNEWIKIISIDPNNLNFKEYSNNKWFAIGEKNA